ncbi:hypothetical protein [Kribbella sp. NPDC023855]|uniref:hypothetical protein n=1 Tax=Kribbella sp. NPDC023855 TaxID=3154698 RepID=UPI0033E30C93
MVRIIEGTVDEVVEYERRIRGEGEATVVSATDVLPDGNDPQPARAAGGGNWAGEDDFFFKQFIYTRAAEGPVAERILDFLQRVVELGTVVEAGESQRSKDGLTDYLMVRDAGPRRFGAVVYVRPSNGGLTVRLRPEDVEDLDDERIKFRDVVESQKYAVNCPLIDDKAVDVALLLTERALQLVRK